jgi:hypothetical protein
VIVLAVSRRSGGGDVVPAAVCFGRAVLVFVAPGGPVQQVIAVAAGWGQHGGPQQAEQFAGADRTSRQWVVWAVARRRVTARTAATSMLMNVQRIQEFQQVVWPWSRPQALLPSWKSSSIAQQVPKDAWARMRTGNGLKGDRHYDWGLRS